MAETVFCLREVRGDRYLIGVFATPEKALAHLRAEMPGKYADDLASLHSPQTFGDNRREWEFRANGKRFGILEERVY